MIDKKMMDDFNELMYMIGKKDVSQKDKKMFEIGRNDVIIFRAIEQIGNGNPIKMNAISQHFSISPSAVSQYMKRFEKDGYIERILLEEDRRSVYVKITQKAKDISDKMYQKSNDHITRLVDILGEEDAKTLLRIMKKTPLYKGVIDKEEKKNVTIKKIF